MYNKRKLSYLKRKEKVNSLGCIGEFTENEGSTKVPPRHHSFSDDYPGNSQSSLLISSSNESLVEVEDNNILVKNEDVGFGFGFDSLKKRFNGRENMNNIKNSICNSAVLEEIIRAIERKYNIDTDSNINESNNNNENSNDSENNGNSNNKNDDNDNDKDKDKGKDKDKDKDKDNDNDNDNDNSDNSDNNNTKRKKRNSPKYYQDIIEDITAMVEAIFNVEYFQSWFFLIPEMHGDNGFLKKSLYEKVKVLIENVWKLKYLYNRKTSENMELSQSKNSNSDKIVMTASLEDNLAEQEISKDKLKIDKQVDL
eukprot:Pgem_evm1s5141